MRAPGPSSSCFGSPGHGARGSLRCCSSSAWSPSPASACSSWPRPLRSWSCRRIAADTCGSSCLRSSPMALWFITYGHGSVHATPTLVAIQRFVIDGIANATGQVSGLGAEVGLVIAVLFAVAALVNLLRGNDSGSASSQARSAWPSSGCSSRMREPRATPAATRRAATSTSAPSSSSLPSSASSPTDAGSGVATGYPSSSVSSRSSPSPSPGTWTRCASATGTSSAGPTTTARRSCCLPSSTGLRLSRPIGRSRTRSATCCALRHRESPTGSQPLRSCAS